jgi:hypothetical protein
VINYANTPGSYSDYISIAPQGSSRFTFTATAYTFGVVSGQKTFSGIAPPGTYVARIYFNNGYVIQAESTPFVVN